MNAEIITIGDEILIGQTVDTNSAWLGQELNKIGVRIDRITSIQDKPTEIVKAIDEAFSRVDLLLVTGGLGPTQDDKTKKTLIEYFTDKLEMNEEVLHAIEEFFISRDLPILEVNRQQAMLPSKAEIIRNYKGSASGMWFKKDDKALLAMPGVPYEMRHIMERQGLDKISSSFKTLPIYHRTVLTTGAGESFLAEEIKDFEAALASEDISIAYLPSPGLVRIRLTAIGENEEEIKKRVDKRADELNERLSKYIFGEDEIKLEEVVGQLLKAKNLKVATAESCTGGYIAHLLTSVPGSSEYYVGSLITYSYDIKTTALDVDRKIIEEKGAVSEEVVIAMADGLKNRFNVDYAIAVSGIAGPGGGIPGKPVGTVWMALANNHEIKTHKFLFSHDRMGNIRRTAIAALNWLRIDILENTGTINSSKNGSLTVE